MRYAFLDDILEIIFDENLVPADSSGTFYALHCPDIPVSGEVNIVNRCYVGYGRLGEFSMMHRNQALIMSSIDDNDFASDTGFSVESAVNPIFGKYEYFLQESFNPEASNTLIFTNPLKRIIRVKLASCRKIFLAWVAGKLNS